MRLVRSAVGALGELLITAGMFLLLFVAWQLWWTDVEANREQAGTIQSLERGFAATAPPAAKETLATLKNVPLGDAFGILRIPRFGADYARPILEGTRHKTLTQGIGHYAGSVMPAQIGNFAVAGHRTTYGRPFHNIDQLRKGDVIVVETKASYAVYRIDRHVIVKPWQVEVVAPVPQKPGISPTQAWMTMTACHPKFSAEYRYVEFAKLDRVFPRVKGIPASLMAVPGKQG